MVPIFMRESVILSLPNSFYEMDDGILGVGKTTSDTIDNFLNSFNEMREFFKPI